MQKGQMILDGHMDDLRTQLSVRRRVVVDLLAPDDRFAVFAREHPHIVDASTDTPTRWFCDVDVEEAGVAQLLRDVVAEGFDLVGFKARKLDLESIILATDAREVS